MKSSVKVNRPVTLNTRKVRPNAKENSIVTIAYTNHKPTRHARRMIPKAAYVEDHSLNTVARLWTDEELRHCTLARLRIEKPSGSQS